MTQTTVGTTGFQPTPRAVERFENRVSELLDVLTDRWIEQSTNLEEANEDVTKGLATRASCRCWGRLQRAD